MTIKPDQAEKEDLILVDVHAHLDHAQFKEDFGKVISEAKAAGVRAIITNGVNPASNRSLLDLAKKDPVIKIAMGLYPLDALGLGADAPGLPHQIGPVNIEEELEFIHSHKENIVAIGEVGLDFKFDEKHQSRQKEVFLRIAEFSKKINKPMIIHSRKAEADIVPLLESAGIKKAVLHCFSGNKKLIQKGSDLGFSFSIPANIVKMEHFQMLTKIVPLPQLLTETDCPWLSPVLGQRNVPQNVEYAVRQIAKIKGLDAKETSLIIYKNYQSMFM